MRGISFLKNIPTLTATLFKKKPLPTVYKNYDALLFLPPISLKLDKKTRIIEKNGVHVAIMYGETYGISVPVELPMDLLERYYEMTTQINNGNPSDRIVYFAIVYMCPEAYAIRREKVLKMSRNVKRKFFVFPRWIWLILEQHNKDDNVVSNFLINKFDDENPLDFSKKEFDTFGAVGITHGNYFLFASVGRKDYIASVNRRISMGLGGL